MEACFSTMFGDVRHERSLKMILSLTDQDKRKQSAFSDHETNIIKDFPAEKSHRKTV